MSTSSSSSTTTIVGAKRKKTPVTSERTAYEINGQHGVTIVQNTSVMLSPSTMTLDQFQSIVQSPSKRTKTIVKWIAVYGLLREWWIGLLMVVQSDIIAAGGVGKLFNLLQERFALFNFSIDIEGKNWFQFHQTLKTPAARNTLLLILATDIAETTRHSIALRKMEEYYQKFRTLKFP